MAIVKLWRKASGDAYRFPQLLPGVIVTKAGVEIEDIEAERVRVAIDEGKTSLILVGYNDEGVIDDAE